MGRKNEQVVEQVEQVARAELTREEKVGVVKELVADGATPRTITRRTKAGAEICDAGFIARAKARRARAGEQIAEIEAVISEKVADEKKARAEARAVEREASKALNDARKARAEPLLENEREIRRDVADAELGDACAVLNVEPIKARVRVAVGCFVIPSPLPTA